ncbi:MAG: O-antigen ligase family protein [Candidatus Omnitrophica bacterium]|nr:O-antigen ligase family protein [Candidatus Omnitrophota bacterium]MBU1996072.1 O-antigen ligase family protein [Candidatus Omnitrophota bacterium]MBU4332832.1 O-antigen ligase family protein [Candidatus Omnitrophota bacterium]
MKIDYFIEKLDSAIRFFFYVLIFWIPYSNAAIESSFGFCFFFWMIKRVLLFIKKDKTAMSFGSKVLLFFNGFKPICSGINRPIYYFLLVSVFSVLWSVSPAMSLFSLFAKTLEVFLIFFVIVEVFTNKAQVFIALGVMTFTAFSTAIDSFIQFYITFKDIFTGQEMCLNDRATAAFKAANGLGAYLVLAIPVVLSMAFQRSLSFLFRLLMMIIVACMVWSLIITYSRGAWAATAVAVLFFVLFAVVKNKKVIKLYLLFTIVAIVVSLFVGLKMKNDFGGKEFNRANTVAWRVVVWEDSIRMIKNKPVFGYGINTFAKEFQKIRTAYQESPTYAHNCYIQIAAENGLLGLFCFLWIIVSMFKKITHSISVRLMGSNNLRIVSVGIAAGIFGLLFHSFFDTDFYSLQLSMFLWSMIAIEIAICNILIKESVDQDNRTRVIC